MSRLLCSFVTCVLLLLFALYFLWMSSHPWTFFLYKFFFSKHQICSKVLILTLVPILHIEGIEKVILEMAPKNQNGLFLNPKNSCLIENCFCKNDPLSSGPVTFLSLVHFLPIFSATDATREGLHLLFGHHKQWGPLFQKWRETLP